MDRTKVLLICVAAALCSEAYAQTPPSVTTLERVYAPPSAEIYDSFVLVNPYTSFFGGSWESPDNSDYFVNIADPTRVAAKCELLASSPPSGCNANMAVYLTTAQALPAPNAPTFCWFGCNTRVSHNFDTFANAPMFYTNPIGDRLESLSAALNNCYGSSFNDPNLCEQQYITQVEASCEEIGLFYMFNSMDGSVIYSNAQDRQAQCRYYSAFERQEIGASIIERNSEPDFFQYTSSLAFGYSLGPFSVAFLELTHQWDTTESFNRALVAARKYENCRNWARAAQEAGCFELI